MTVDRTDQDLAESSGRWRRRRGRRAPEHPRSRRRLFAAISLATRLALVALLVTLISLVVTATVGLVRGNELADELADDRVVAVAASQADAVELYFGGIAREISALATSPGTRDAIDRLTDAYLDLSDEPIPSSTSSDLTHFYLSEVVPALEDVRGDVVGTSFLEPDGSAAIYLQSVYTIPGVDEDGGAIEPGFVVDPGDGSDYSEVHAAIHPTYGQIAARSGFEDLFLIAERNDVVVYSARKRIDFATSLDLGPMSGSSLDRLIEGMSGQTDAEPAIADFAPYPPAGDRPMAFVASPVLDDGRRVGYVAAALAIEPLDDVVSGNGTWPGLGDTGDAYLVGPDGTMRSTARPFQQSPSTFLADSDEPGPGQLTEAQRRTIAATGTTALVQEVNRAVLTSATSGAGTVQAADFRGTEVRTGYRPVDVGDLGWVMFSEVPAVELNEPIEQYARNMLLAVALFVVAVTFIAVRWSTRLMAPIRAIANRLRSARADPARTDEPDTGSSLPSRSPAEYDELAVNIDQMLRRLADHQRAVQARSEERARLLRQFLPAGLARRSEEADGETVDHVGNASVVVVILEGISDLASQRSADELHRLLADLIDEADALAADLGLERIRVVGGVYVAACGASRPYFDHAPRSVAFALGFRDLADELSGGLLSVRGGVDDGAIAVGLAERSGLVYDAWGSAVAEAERLANGSPPGAVTVSAVVRRQLPDDFVLARDPIDDTEPAVVTGRIGEEAPA